MVAVSDFSGLMSSAWALARADARAATDSLDRGMGRLCREEIKAYRARFRALCSYAMPDGLLGILGHQGLQFGFCPLMLEKGLPSGVEQGRELGPRVGVAHIDDADGFDARPWRLGIDKMGSFAGLD